MRLKKIDPFGFFVYCVGAGAVLAYAPLPVPWVRWGVILGLGLPLAGALFLGFRPLSRKVRTLSRVSPRFLLAPLAMGLFLRFHHLTDFAVWPNWDEGINAYYASKNMEGWDGRLGYFYSNIQPLYVWLLAVLFKALSPSLFALWILPAVLSAAAAFLTYRAVEPLVGPDGRRAAAFFLALSYWPLALGRYSHQFVLLYFWTCAAFWGLSRLSVMKRVGWRASLALGVWTGLGFWVFFSWPFVALAVTLGFVMLTFRDRERRGRWAVFGMPVALGSLPTVGGFIFGLYRHHIGHLLENRSYSDNHWLAPFQALLTGPPTDAFRYGPFWGGFLNPLEIALVLLGCIVLVRSGRKGAWFGLSFALLLTPAVLARLYYNGSRLPQLVPLLVWALAVGWERLLVVRPGLRRIATILALLSLGLSQWHLWGPNRDWVTKYVWIQRIAEHGAAFRVLEGLRVRDGEGEIYLRLFGKHFEDSHTNPAIDVFTKRYNVLADDTGRPPAWVALFTEEHHADLLERMAPGLERVPLSEGTATVPERYCLYVGRAGDVPEAVRKRWAALEASLKRIETEGFEDEKVMTRSREGFLEAMDRLEALRRIHGADPFLRRILAEKQFLMSIRCWDVQTARRIRDREMAAPDPSSWISGVKGLYLPGL